MASPPMADRKVQTAQSRGRGVSPDMNPSINSGLPEQSRRQNASIYTFYPHVEYRADSELTEFESNRDEWV